MRQWTSGKDAGMAFETGGGTIHCLNVGEAPAGACSMAPQLHTLLLLRCLQAL